MNESIVSIAKELKNASKNAKRFEGFLLGKVVAPLPNIKIQTSDEVVLDASNLIFAAHLVDDHIKSYEIVGTNPLEKGKIKFTDKLQNGEILILIPSDNDNMYIVVDRAVML